MCALFLAGAFFSQAQSKTGEDVRKYHQEWDAAGVETLEVTNKFGEVKVTNSTGAQVIIDVTVRVESESESVVQKILGDINVGFSKTGGTAKAETTIRDDFRTKRNFSIDYAISIPSDKNLTITNKYGNTVVDELLGKGIFNIGYGNMNANRLLGSAKGKITLNLDYGKCDVSSLGDATVTIAYSKFYVDEANNLTLNSKYSGLKLGKADEIKAESKYDGFEVEKVSSLVANLKYTSVKIGELDKKLILTSGYGGIRVDRIPASFEQVVVNNSFGAVNLGFASDSQYRISAECEYCEIEYPGSKFKGTSEKDDFTKKIAGTIGGTSPKGDVTIKSRYGKINLEH